jgi:hypothetical protein
MIIYIAGPMRGMPRYNFDAFFGVATELERRGHQVINPAQDDIDLGFDPDEPLEDQMEILGGLTGIIRRDLDGVLVSDAIYMLDGWGDSVGATAERCVAYWAGKKILDSRWLEEDNA